MEQNLAAHRVLQLILLFNVASCAICMKTTLPSSVKEVSVPIRKTPCYSFMVNVSLSNAVIKASNTLRCYDNEGTRKRRTSEQKREMYRLKFSNIKMPAKMPELLKLVELKIYMPLSLVMEVRHRISGADSVTLALTEFHTVTAARLGWQTFNVTSLFNSVRGNPVSLHTKVILRNFTAPSSHEKGGAVWREEKPMLFVSTEESNIEFANLMKSSGARTSTSNFSKPPRKRTARSARSKACPKTPFSWSVTSTDLGPVMGSKYPIISPTSVSLDYCSGKCKHSLLVNFHSGLQAKFAKKPARLALPAALGVAAQPDQLPWLPFPCCVPVKYGPLNILYLDENSHLVYKTLQDAIATECGCR